MTRQQIEICSIWPLALATIFVTTVLLLHATEIALKALPLPTLHKSWRIKLKDKYPVSFIVDIVKSSLKIAEFIVCDECFGQPHPCGKEEYRQIEQIINELVNKKILERCKE